MSINSICPTCFRRLPVDSKVCPNCSSRLPKLISRKFKVKWKTQSGRWLTKTVVGLPLARKVEDHYRTQAVEASVLGVVRCPTLHTVWSLYHKATFNGNKKSLPDDAQRFRDYLAPRLGNLPINRIRPEDIETALEGMRQAGKSPATQRLVFALLRMLFNWSSRRQLFRGPSPCSMVRAPKVDNSRTRVLTTEEAERLLKALKESPNRHFSVVIRFLLYTGKRRGEVRRLEWSDVDLQAKTVVFRGENTKTGKTTIIPLSEPALDSLEEANILWEKSEKKSPLVFPSSTGGPYHDLNATWTRFRVKIGLMDVRIHDLRRSFGSWAVSNGVDLYTVSKLLGHSSTIVTQRVYAHLNLDALRRGTEVVSQVLGKLDNGGT